MTDNTRITFELTRAEQDALQYAIARRRAQVQEYIRTAEASGMPAAADNYREEDTMLARCAGIMARTVGRHAVAEINAMNARALQREDTPAWMEGMPVELD